MEEAQAKLGFHATRLSAGTRLILLLLRLRFQLDAEDMATLSAHLTPLVDDSSEQGWEERTDGHVRRAGSTLNRPRFPLLSAL